MRIERDSLGEVQVPSERYYGAQTARSLTFFNIGIETIPWEVIEAFAVIKKAAAEVNRELGLLDRDIAALIREAAQAILSGHLNAEFPLRVWQTGSGTHTNMNVNEVIANWANEKAGTGRGASVPVHPNDHVNMSQSSNDTFPAAMHIAAVASLRRQLLPSLVLLRDSLDTRRAAFDGIVKIGRTHLMDAVPLTLGQEFSGYVTQINYGIERVERCLPSLFRLALGGTAVGTGLNAHPAFAARIAARIAETTGEPFVSAENKFEALAANDAIVETSGALTTLAASLMKIGNDVRLLASGPRCGIGELRLPANQPGSSIMPGKVNPAQCEALTMIAVQVMGNNTTIGIAGASGALELNVYKPVLIYNLLQSVRLLADGCRSFALNCIDGTEANREIIKAYVNRSLMLVTALSPRLGYETAARIAKKAFDENCTLKAAALGLGVLSEQEFDQIVVPSKMTGPSLRDGGKLSPIALPGGNHQEKLENGKNNE
jgi:fumarate hydratase class II